MKWYRLYKESEENLLKIVWTWSNEYGDADYGQKVIEVPSMELDVVKAEIDRYLNSSEFTYSDAGGYCDSVNFDVYVDFVPGSKPVFLIGGSFEDGKCEWKEEEV